MSCLQYISRIIWVGLLTAVWACGQSGHAELYGTIKDASGLNIAGVGVTLEQRATHAMYSAETGTTGDYHFLALLPGGYVIEASKPGFRTMRRAGLQLQVADRISLDLLMEVGESGQTVEVNGAAPVLQTSTGTVSFLIDQEKVITFPLDGRNFVPLIALSPGVMLPPGQLLPRINGSRPRTSEYLYDGISVLQPEPGQVAYYPVIDAIDEFRVQLNSYSAEYGRSNGGIIQVSTKAGTDAYHGTLFEFFRNEALNARNLFATTGPKPLFRRNQFGFVLGGPIQNEKLFFFVDWQQTPLRTGVTRFSTVPTSLQRRGIFSVPIFDPATTVLTSAGYSRSAFVDNTIPSSRFDAAGLAVLNRYPPPNVFTAAGAEAIANNFRRTGADATGAAQFDTRLDRYFLEKHRIFSRYSFLRDDSSPTTPLPDGSGDITTGITGNRLTRADSVVAEHAWTISAASVNQLRFGFTRRGSNQTALQTGKSAGAPPTFQPAGFQQIGPPGSANSRLTTSVTEFIEEFSTIRGRHSLKVGADIRLERLDVLQPANPSGLFQFSPVLTCGLSSSGSPRVNTGNSIASLLLGEVQNFSADAQPAVLKPRATITEGFLQDDWKIAPRLTVNAGVRYTLNFPSVEANNRGAVFDLKTQELNFLGQNGYPRTARNLEKRNFAPRVGVAYALTPTFAVRGGYGLTWIEQAGITTPFTTPLFPYIQTRSQQSLDNINPAFLLSSGPTVRIPPISANAGLGQGVFATQRNNGSGYAQQWNVTLQKAFGKNWSVEAGYLGSKITRLGVPDVNLNQLTVEQLTLGSKLTQPVGNPFYGQIPVTSPLGRKTIPYQQLLRPYPRFTTVALYRNNIGHSTYHALQTHLEKRFADGLTLTAAYTFSKLIDDAGAVFDSALLTGPVSNFQAADSFNKPLEKDESTGSIPQVFAAGFDYEIPFAHGWRIAGIARAQAGAPVAVTQSTNFNAAFGFGIQRPNRVGDPNLPHGDRTTGRYFNTAAFGVAPQFTIGTSSRNPVRGPGYEAADLMIGKIFRVREKWTMEFRLEAFNISNTPPLGAPNGSFGSAAFGTITTALDPRVVEMAVKIRF